MQLSHHLSLMLRQIGILLIRRSTDLRLKTVIYVVACMVIGLSGAGCLPTTSYAQPIKGSETINSAAEVKSDPEKRIADLEALIETANDSASASAALVEAINDASPDVQIFAAGKLAARKQKTESVFKVLKSLLDGPASSTDIKLESIDILRSLDVAAPRKSALLKAHMESSQPLVRIAAAATLSELGLEQDTAANVLIESVQDSGLTNEVRLVFVEALFDEELKLDSALNARLLEELVSILRVELQDRSLPNEKKLAIAKVFMVHNLEAEKAVAAAWEVFRQSNILEIQLDALETIGEEARQIPYAQKFLVSTLSSEDLAERLAASALLLYWDIEIDRAAAVLVKAIEDRELATLLPKWHELLINIVEEGRKKDRRIALALERALDNNEPNIRVFAALASLNVKANEDKAVAVLSNFLNTEIGDIAMRRLAIDYLSRMEGPLTVTFTESLINMLDHEDVQVSLFAASVLLQQNIESDRAFDVVLKVLEASTDDLVDKALNILKDYVTKHPNPPALNSPKVVDVLIKEMGENEPEYRRISAIEILSHTGDNARAALPALTGRLKDSSYRVQLAAAKTLLSFDPDYADARRILVMALRSENPDIRNEAVWELLDVTDTSGMIGPMMANWADQSEEIQIGTVRVLRHWGAKSPRVLDALTTAFGSSHAVVRKKAIEALPYRASAATVDALVSVLQSDPDESVRTSASRAIARVATDVPHASRARVVQALVKVAMAQTTSSELRVIIAQTLGNFTAMSDVPVAVSLIKLLQDDSDSVAVAAAEALGRVAEKDKPQTVSSLAAIISDETKGDDVRAAAAASLSRVPQDLAADVTDVLLKVVNAEPPKLRAAAIASLGSLPEEFDTSLGPILIKALQDPNQKVRYAASDAIESRWTWRGIDDAATVEALVAILGVASNNSKVRGAAARVLGSSKAKMEVSGIALAKALGDDDSAVKLAAAKAIQRLPREVKKEALEPLIRLLEDPNIDRELRAAVLESLTEVPDDQKGRVIAAIEAIYINDPSVWIDAAPTLESLGGGTKRILSLTLNALGDPDPEVRLTAISAFAKMPNVASAAPLRLADALKDSDPKVKAEAAQLFGRLPRSAKRVKGVAIDNIIETLKDNDPDIRLSATRALKDLEEDDRGKAVQALIIALNDNAHKVREEAARALGFREPESAKERAVDALVKRLAAEDDSAVRLAVANALRDAPQNKETKVIPAMIVALHDASFDVRASAAAVLGATKTQRSATVNALREALSDPEPNVRSAAAASLGEIGVSAKAADEQLFGMISDDNPNVRRSALAALSRVGLQPDKVVDALGHALQDSNPNVRAAAVNALGTAGTSAKPVIRPLAERLRVEEKSYYKQDIAKSLIRIANAFLDARDLEANDDLFFAQKTLEKVPDMEDLSNDLKRVVNLLHDIQPPKPNPVLTWLAQHPKITVGMSVYALLVFLVFLTLWIYPLLLLTMNEMLKPIDVQLPKWLGGIKLSARYALPVAFFHYHPRVLDAWVRKRIDIARERFSGKETVKDRSLHVPMPVVIDHSETVEPTPKELKSIIRGMRWCLLIAGEGGSGKTSLACQLAQWGMAQESDGRLCPHLMLPVLIEDELTQSTDEAASPLIQAIHGQLSDVTASQDQIPLELLDKLLKRRRILVIVDHYSEMSIATRKLINPAESNFPCNALIVTSRQEESLGNVTKTPISPTRIEGGYISDFLGAYLKKLGVRRQFTDTEFFAACTRITEIVGERDVTLLFAKLFVDFLVKSIDSELPTTKLLATGSPENVPELFLAYINSLNANVEPDIKCDERSIQQWAQIVAWGR